MNTDKTNKTVLVLSVFIRIHPWPFMLWLSTDGF